MPSPELERLVEAGSLHRQARSQPEYDSLVASGRARLRDAGNTALSLESRFDLAYNAAHALSLAALRWHGYRSSNRYVVFQVLEHTLGIAAPTWRTLSTAHGHRNQVEYEGGGDVDGRLVTDLIEAAGVVERALSRLKP